ncbi:MAG: cupredoxin domain-containing protein [Micromonosporaceae bacterium]
MLATVVLTALLAGCGGGSGGGGGTSVDVTLTDFKLAFSEQPTKPGKYTFNVKNEGKVDHALKVEGQGIEEETETLAPGKSATLTVTLQKGSYEFYCPVGDHDDKGMKTTIEVGGSGGGNGETGGTSDDNGGY